METIAYGDKCSWHPRFPNELEELIAGWKLHGLGESDLMRMASLLIQEHDQK